MARVLTEPKRVTPVTIDQQTAGAWHMLFFAVWLFIIFVSVLDGYLMVIYADEVSELNPLGQLLINWNEGRMWYLLTAKFFGTIIVCSFLRVAYTNCRQLGMSLTMIIGMCQSGLLLFLFLA